MTAPLEPTRFAGLMRGLADGSPEAAEEILRLCGPTVFRVVRRRLGRRSPRFDSADVAQAVWASFFGHLDRNVRFDGPDDMVRYLAAMAANKVRKAQRDHFGLQKRAADREVPLAAAEAGRYSANGPTPSQCAMADEAWQRLLAETPRSYQQMLYMRLDGKSHEEIAATLGVSSRTVGRIMGRLQRKLQP